MQYTQLISSDKCCDTLLGVSLPIPHEETTSGDVVITLWFGVSRARTALPNWSHRCSMGLKSGEQAGHSSTFTLFFGKWYATIRAVRGLALSCWCTTLGPSAARRGYLHNLTNVAPGIPIALYKDQIRFACGCDACPYHDAPTIVGLGFYSTFCCAFTLSPPQLYPTIIAVHAKSGLDSKENVSPLTSGPSCPSPTPSQHD